MLRVVFGLFLIAHGVVYLLYFGHSGRFFELQPGLAWPDCSWVFSNLLGDPGTRTLASASCVVAAFGFIAGGIGLWAGQSWWRPMVVGAAAFSAVVFLLFWNGKRYQMDDQGLIGVLISVVLLVLVLIAEWPSFEFA